MQKEQILLKMLLENERYVYVTVALMMFKFTSYFPNEKNLAQKKQMEYFKDIKTSTKSVSYIYLICIFCMTKTLLVKYFFL